MRYRPISSSESQTARQRGAAILEAALVLTMVVTIGVSAVQVFASSNKKTLHESRCALVALRFAAAPQPHQGIDPGGGTCGTTVCPKPKLPCWEGAPDFDPFVEDQVGLIYSAEELTAPVD
jgi:hypothetical protein